MQQYSCSSVLHPFQETN